MLHIEAHTDKITERLNAMKASIEAFGKTDMPQELTNWQVEDMHRHYPETQIEQTPVEVSAFTMIYPRSRTYEKTHPHRPRTFFVRPKRALSSMPVLKASKIRHPILRPILFDMLLTRMSALLSRKITWRSTSQS